MSSTGTTSPAAGANIGFKSVSNGTTMILPGTFQECLLLNVRHWSDVATKMDAASTMRLGLSPDRATLLSCMKNL